MRSGSVSPTVGIPSVKKTTTPSAPSAGDVANASASAPAMFVPPSAEIVRTHCCASRTCSVDPSVHAGAYRRTSLLKVISRNRSPARNVPSSCTSAALAWSSFSPDIEPDTSSTATTSRCSVTVCAARPGASSNMK